MAAQARKKTTAAASVANEPRDPLRSWLLAGMMALLVARPLFPSESVATGDSLTVVMLWLALAVSTLIVALRKRPLTLRFGAIDVAALLFFGWIVVSALWPGELRSPRPTLNAMWEWIGLGVAFFVMRQLVETARETRAVIAVMIALAVGISAYGLYQSWWEMARSREAFAADPEGAMRAAGVYFQPGSAERKHFEDRLQNTEPLATFALTNSLAAFLSPWLIVLLGIAASVRAHRRQLLWIGLCSLPIVACFLATKSRSGYIAVGVGFLLLLWLFSASQRARISRKLWTVGLTLVIVAGAAALAIEGPAVFRRAAKSFGYRVQYWQSSLALIAEHPWLGCGPGNFQETYTAYKLPDASEEIADPHNFLFEIWTNAGTPAALAFLAMLVCFFRGTISLSRASMKPMETRLAREPRTGPHPGPLPKGEGTIVEAAASDVSCDGMCQIIIGGVVGFLIALPLGAISAAPPSLAVLAIGLPAAVVAFATLWGWVRNGRLMPMLPAAAVAVLLVDLLTTGGIAFPGVAANLWLLFVIGLGGAGDRPVDWRATLSATVVGVGLLIACYRTAYQPVVTSHNLMLQVEQSLAAGPMTAGQEASLFEQLEAAAAADPRSADPWRMLAELRFRQWRSDPSADRFARFEAAQDRVTQLSPRSAVEWQMAGIRYLDAAERLANDQTFAADANRKAATCFQRAVQFYPNDATARAMLAEAYLRLHQQAEFRREAEKALWLDRVTPHSEKKLPDERRQFLQRQLSKAK